MPRRDWLGAITDLAIGGPAVARPRPRSTFEPETVPADGGLEIEERYAEPSLAAASRPDTRSSSA